MESFFYNILGKTGVLGIIGLLTFVTAYKNSVPLFDWIEQQTIGNRDYLLKKFDLMFIKVDALKLTYALWLCSFGSGVLTAIFLIYITENFPIAAIASLFVGFIGWKIPRPLTDFFYERRLKKFQQQMVDALNLLAGGLRAGLSLQQACGLVTTELPNPVAEEFNLILQQNRLGIPIDECFQNLHERVPTEDNQMFVSCISILRETGGNLAEIFDTIAQTIRERVRLNQKIASATAMQRMQGMVLFVVPFFMFIVNWLNDPQAMMQVLTSPKGAALLGLSFLLTLVGGALIYKIVNIKV